MKGELSWRESAQKDIKKDVIVHLLRTIASTDSNHTINIEKTYNMHGEGTSNRKGNPPCSRYVRVEVERSKMKK